MTDGVAYLHSVAPCTFTTLKESRQFVFRDGELIIWLTDLCPGWTLTPRPRDFPWCETECWKYSATEHGTRKLQNLTLAVSSALCSYNGCQLIRVPKKSFYRSDCDICSLPWFVAGDIFCRSFLLTVCNSIFLALQHLCVCLIDVASIMPPRSHYHPAFYIYTDDYGRSY